MSSKEWFEIGSVEHDEATRIEVAKQRLDSLLQDFVKRGASPKETASVIFTYGVCELLSYAETPSEGAEIVDEVLLNCFGIENSGVTLKQIFFTDGFVKDDEPE